MRAAKLKQLLGIGWHQLAGCVTDSSSPNHYRGNDIGIQVLMSGVAASFEESPPWQATEKLLPLVGPERKTLTSLPNLSTLILLDTTQGVVV
jgi:hypothetical protein